ALGAFVNFTNCRVSKPNRRVNVTSISIDPYPLPLSRLTYFTITAETTGPTVIKLDFVNSGADDLRIKEYFGEIRMFEDTNIFQTMCVTFRYLWPMPRSGPA
ncbi:hypothetical protein HID58_080741, partial [Brassica napus]